MIDPPLAETEAEILDTVRTWIDSKVAPHASELERIGEYPEALIDEMKRFGVFGMTIPDAFGGLGLSIPAYALITEEIARGWMSLSGSYGGHSVVAKLIEIFGRDDQRDRYLPRMATGELRAAMALTEPSGGSDLQAMHTRAVASGDSYIVNGTKTWITNAQHAGLIALLCKTDPSAQPSHTGISILLVEPGPGLTISRPLPKLGYRGIESCELTFEDFEAPKETLLGTDLGAGFSQMMKGLELGRIQVAARAVGVARAALEDALSYSQERTAFGKPIWRHQSIGNYLADMATRVEASRLLVLNAASAMERGDRCDLEAGMAKLFASEAAMEVALNAMRIHGAYGYSTEFDIERYFRDAPLMIIGEGTNEIQRNVIVRQLMARQRSNDPK